MRLELTSERGCVDLEVGDVDRLAEDVARHATVEAAVLSVHPGDGVAVQLRSNNLATHDNYIKLDSKLEYRFTELVIEPVSQVICPHL